MVVVNQGQFRHAWFKYFTAILGIGAMAVTIDFLLKRHRAGIAPYHDREVFLMFAGGVFVLGASVASIVFARVFPPPPYKEGEWALTSYLRRLKRGFVELVPLSEVGKPTIVTVLRNGSYSGSRLQ